MDRQPISADENEYNAAARGGHGSRYYPEKLPNGGAIAPYRWTFISAAT